MKISTIDDIKLSAGNHGSHFFDRDTLRFFDSRILSDVFSGPGGIYFVTSERFRWCGTRGVVDGQRLFTVRQYKAGQVETIGGFQTHQTARSAKHMARELAEKGTA